MTDTFMILSIDGGGIRGVYPAHILSCIEKRLNINLFNTFDMIAGTSTGSIVATSVAMCIPVDSIINMYKEHGPYIFNRKRSYWPYKDLCPMFKSIYNNRCLKDVLSFIFKKKQLGDIKKPLLIPSTDIGNGCVHVFKSNYSSEFTRDNKVQVKDAVLASCSAPIFFDPHRLNEYLLADGGLWANNPALAAVIDAQKRLDILRDDIKILSIGTGHFKTAYGTNDLRKWGLMNGWRHKDLIGFILSLQSQSALNYLTLMLRPEQIKRIDFESDLLMPLDDVSNINDLISRADHKFTHECKSIKEFLSD